MSAMPRLVLASLVGVAVLIPLAMIGEALDFGSWGMTGIGFAVMLLVSAIDREGFYGPREDDSLK